mgnify:CR=1 FL=1
MGGDRRRSPEGDRKALWNYANDQFDRKINSGYSKKLTFFILAGDFASAEATKGLSDRPLETFGCTLLFIGFYRKFFSLCTVSIPNKNN